MRKKELETRALQGEIASNREESAELERRVAVSEKRAAEAEERAAKAEEWATLSQKQAAEAEVRFGMLKGELDVIRSDAFQFGAEDIRGKISEEHPEWDLSFLDANVSDAHVSGDEGEEDEYVDASDTDPSVAPDSGDGAASGGHSATAIHEAKRPETGEPSCVPTSAAEDSIGVDPTPSPEL